MKKSNTDCGLSGQNVALWEELTDNSDWEVHHVMEVHHEMEFTMRWKAGDTADRRHGPSAVCRRLHSEIKPGK